MDKTNNKIARNAAGRLKICMLSTGHSHLDDRIYYKEALSLLPRFGKIIIVASGKVRRSAETPEGIEFISLGQWRSLWSRFSLIPKAVVTVMRIKPDVCHFHDFELIFALPFLRLFSRCRIIYDVHEVYPETMLESEKVPRLLRHFLAKLVDLCEKFLCRFSHCIVTSDASISARFTGIHSSVTTVFNYPRLSIFVPSEEKLSALRERYRGRRIVVYQGSVGESRGLFLMIRAMNILKEKKPEIVLLIVGAFEDTLLDRAMNEIRAQNVEDCVEIIGWVPHTEVVNYIFAADVGLVPLLPTEKFMKNIPIKQFEYMACGLPVLGADLPPIASYVNASGSGKVFDSKRPEALAEGIMSILEDENEWKRMSEAGKKAVRELWNWGEMEKRLFRVYEELLRM